jgi:hypothetical protein
MKLLLEIVKRLPKPIVVCAGHTLGAFDRSSLKYLPLLPPYLNKTIAETARMLRVGDTPLQSLEEALLVVAGIVGVKFAFLLNDTTNIRKRSADPGKKIEEMRSQLSSAFAGEFGLPDSYIKILEEHGVGLDDVLVPFRTTSPRRHQRRFWTESELRNRFFRTVKGNHAFFYDKVSLLSSTDPCQFGFHGLGELNYCKLSSSADSITGGPECVAEVIQFCLEIFGCMKGALSYRHQAVQSFSLGRGGRPPAIGTLIIFYPRICHDHVTSGLRFYRKHLSDSTFDWVSVPYSSSENDGIQIDNIESSI